MRRLSRLNRGQHRGRGRRFAGIISGFIFFAVAVCLVEAETKGPRDRFQATVPASAARENQEGLEAMQRREYDPAIQKFDKALTIMPNYYSALFNRALALDFRSAKGDDDRTEQAWRRALEIAGNEGIRDV